MTIIKILDTKPQSCLFLNQINTTAIQSPSEVISFKGLQITEVLTANYWRENQHIANFAMMSKYLVQVLITLFLFAESSPTENIEITRSIGSSDSFHIPESVCEEEDGKRSHQFCTTICKEQDDDFSCSCPESNSTLIYRNNLWKCRGNIEVRTQLGRWKHFYIVTKHFNSTSICKKQPGCLLPVWFLITLTFVWILFPLDYKCCAYEKDCWLQRYRIFL